MLPAWLFFSMLQHRQGFSHGCLQDCTGVWQTVVGVEKGRWWGLSSWTFWVELGVREVSEGYVNSAHFPSEGIAVARNVKTTVSV